MFLLFFFYIVLVFNKNWLNWSSNLQKNNERKHPRCFTLCAFRCIGFNWSILLFEWAITSFSEVTLLQTEPFPTMFWTISCLVVLGWRNRIPYYCLYVIQLGIIHLLLSTKQLCQEKISQWNWLKCLAKQIFFKHLLY